MVVTDADGDGDDNDISSNCENRAVLLLVTVNVCVKEQSRKDEKWKQEGDGTLLSMEKHVLNQCKLYSYLIASSLRLEHLEGDELRTRKSGL